MAPRDRYDLGCLAAALLLWALLVAPLAHQLSHTHAHTHDAPALEHHQLALGTPVDPPTLHLTVVALADAFQQAPDPAEPVRRRRAEQPQGP